ncbi:MAG: hypothetical protein JOS17DRAFT_772898 [Linnemannia elongata]|nr:MAG: hypothetical protein JOS17DRAFT_772898 [Linnemannia elongata]
MNVDTTPTASAKIIYNPHQYQAIVDDCHIGGRTPCLVDLSEDDPTDLSNEDIVDLTQPVQQIQGNNSTASREWISLLEDQSQDTKETEGYYGGLQNMKKGRKKEGVIVLDENTQLFELEDEESGVRRGIEQEYEPTAFHEVSERINCSGHVTTAPRQDYMLVEDELAGGDREVDEEEGEDTLLDYGRVQMPEFIESVAKDHDPTDDVVEVNERDDGYEMAVAATVFDDEYLDLLFNRIARLYGQLPTRVAQDILPYMFTCRTPSPSSASFFSTFDSVINDDSTTTTSSATAQAVATFFQPSKTVSRLWKRWFTSCHASELDRISIWMLEVYFKNWKKKTLVTKKQKDVFEVEKRVVRTVLEKVRDSEIADEKLMQGRGCAGGGNGRRRGGGTNAGVGGSATLRERVESAKEAIEADVVRKGGMRRYHYDLGLVDGITWKVERCPQIYIKHKV